MERKSTKKIVLKKEAISILNNSQMNQKFGGRGLSAITMNEPECDSLLACCTMYEDCQVASIFDCATRIITCTYTILGC